MKKLFALLALALLSSCIDVEDVSDTWDKAVVEPSLAGVWKQVESSDAWRFSKAGDSFSIVKVKASGEADGDATLARTITIEKHMFLLLKEENKKNGNLIRFDVNGNKATQYGFGDMAKVTGWIQQNHPQVRTMSVISDGISGPLLKILKLDAPTLALVSQIPDEYWVVTANYVKQ